MSADAKQKAEPPVAGSEFRTDAGPSEDFETTPEGSNEQIDRDDQGAAVEIKSNPFPHEVTDDGVVVLPDEAATKTPGGLIIPNVAQKRIFTGRVLAVGPGKTYESGFLKKPTFKAGARVLYGRYAGEQLDLKFQGRDVILMRIHDVRLVLKQA